MLRRIFPAHNITKSCANLVQKTVLTNATNLRVDGWKQRCSRGHKAQDQGQEYKKIRGQSQGEGQSFRGQTLSRPRTRMLKDQGHKCKCSQKKRSFKKFFRRSQNKEKKRKVFKQIFHKVFQKKRRQKGLPKFSATFLRFQKKF